MFAPQPSLLPAMSALPVQPPAANGVAMFPRVGASHRSRPSADADAAAAAATPVPMPMPPVHPAAAPLPMSMPMPMPMAMTMPLMAPAAAPGPDAAGAPATGRGRRERVRSRSFDHSFVAQLHAFHLAQQARAQAAALQQAHMQAHMQAQRGFGATPLGAALPHAMQQRLQAHPLPPPPPPNHADSHTAASPRLHRERLLREAYLSHGGVSGAANGTSSPPPASPPASHRALAARSAQLQQPGPGTRSAPPGSRGSRTPGGRSRSLAPQWYPHQHHGGGGHGGGLHNAGGFVGLTTPLFALPGQFPGHGYLPHLGGGGAMAYPLLPHHSAGGSRIYGYINTARANMSPLPPPAASAAPGTDANAAAANSSDASAAATTAADLAASAASGAGGKAARPAPPPGKGQGKTGRKGGTSSGSQSDLHDDVEVLYTDADASTEAGIAGAHGTSSTASAAAVAAARAARRARKERSEKGDKEKEKDKAGAGGGGSGGAEAKASSSSHPKDEGVYGSSAHREQNKARMKEREAAALQRINDAEAERVRAERARAAKDAAEKALKAKQREALAESALARAKQSEQQKAREAALEEAERLAREKEKLALARLRSQLPMPTFFSPTLAYALKVESSHNRGDARSPRKMDIDRRPPGPGKATGAAVAAAGAAEEKQNGDAGSHPPGPGRRGANPHGRKPSLYDGADWDQMRSLQRGGGGAEGEDGEADAVEEGDEAAEHEEHAEEGDDHEDAHHDDAEAHDDDDHDDAAAAAAAGAAPSASTAAASAPALSGGRRGHTRSLSTIAREHISAQLSKISSKHTGAHTKLQRLRTQTRQKLAASADEKQRRIDEIRVARTEELRRMAQAITALELAQTPGAKVESQFVLAMPLARAAKAGDLDAIRALAADKEETAGDVRAWVNRHDSAGSTAIFHATWTAHEGVLALLFALGADANATNNRQNTALHLACDRAHYAVIRLLLEQGANPLLKNHEGHASFEMQSRNSAESLEMALYIRQCLEDFILEKSARFGAGGAPTPHGLELGLGMASVQAAEHTAAPTAAAAEGSEQSADSNRAELLAAAATAAGVGPDGALAADPSPAGAATASATSPAASAAGAGAGGMSSSVSTGSLAIPSLAPSSNLPPGLQARLLQTHQYLAGVNAYISARIALSQSIRRVKMKIWSAVRVKLRLGAFSQLRRVDQAAADALAVADAQDQEEADAKETDAPIAEEEEEQEDGQDGPDANDADGREHSGDAPAPAPDDRADAGAHAHGATATPAPASDLPVVSIPIPADVHAHQHTDDHSQEPQQQKEATAAAE